jgi:hypothetical protein
VKQTRRPVSQGVGRVHGSSRVDASDHGTSRCRTAESGETRAQLRDDLAISPS